MFAIVHPHRRGVDDLVAERTLGALEPFGIEAEAVEVARRGQVVAVSWAVHPGAFGLGGYTAGDAGHWATYNGYPLLRDPQDDHVGAALLAAFRDGRLPGDLEGGYYAVAATDGDEVHAITGLSNTEPIYYARSPEATVVGNRASLVQRLAYGGGRYAYDLDALVSMCTTGWPVHLEVPFEGVELLPPGTHLRVGDGGETRHTYRSLPFGAGADASVDEAATVVAERLKAAATGLARLNGGELELNLSGGKDSRVVVAAAWAAGLKVRCVTSGTETDREVVVAREVAGHLDLPLTWTTPQVQAKASRPDIPELLDRQVLHGEGMSSIYDPCYPVRSPEAPVRLVGHGGEIFKGGYDSMKGGRRPPITSPADVERFLENLALPNRAVLTADAIARQRRLNAEFAAAFFDAGSAPEDFYDHVYVRLREARGNGVARQASGFGAMLYSPFLDDRALEAVLSTTADARAEQVLYAKVLERFDPALARIRFADSRWRFEESGPVDWFDPDGWEARAPLPAGEKRGGQKGWRQEFDGPLRDPVTDVLFGDPASPLFDLVDREALRAKLDSDEPTPTAMLRTVYGATTVQHLLADAWYRPSGPRPGARSGWRQRLAGLLPGRVAGA